MRSDAPPEPGWQAAQVLLDALTAWDDSRPDDNIEAINLAVHRLGEVDVVRATFDNETDELSVDLSDLIGGTAVLLQWLVTQLALATDVDRLDVISRARTFIQGL